jgi:hypothetical protein
MSRPRQEKKERRRQDQGGGVGQLFDERQAEPNVQIIRCVVGRPGVREIAFKVRRRRGRRPGVSRVQRVPTDPQPLREEERQGEEQNREPEDRTVAAPSITHDDIIEEPAAGGKGRCRRDWCPPAREPIRSSRVVDGCPL